MKKTYSLRWLGAVLIAYGIGAFADNHMNPYWASVFLYAGINIVLASSLNLITGFTGQFSIGHGGFMAVGAYTAAALSLYFQRNISADFMQSEFGRIFWLCFTSMVGGFAALIAGIVVGLPTLRLRGDYLAIVTLGFGEIIRVVLLNIDSLGGARGLPGIPKLSSLSNVYPLAIIGLFFLWRTLQAPSGREFVAVREDEIAAEAMGVPTTYAKVRAFSIGAFWAGLGGSLSAHALTYLNPSSFDFNRSFEVLIMVVLGGMGSLTGSVVAAVFLTVLRELLRELQTITQVDYRMIFYSLFLIILMLVRPQGLMGNVEWMDLVRRFIKKKEGQI